MEFTGGRPLKTGAGKELSLRNPFGFTLGHRERCDYGGEVEMVGLAGYFLRKNTHIKVVYRGLLLRPLWVNSHLVLVALFVPRRCGF